MTQIVSRACARSVHRLVVTLGVERDMVVRVPLAIDGGGDLASIHPVDVSEVLRDLGLVVA